MSLRGPSQPQVPPFLQGNVGQQGTGRPTPKSNCSAGCYPFIKHQLSAIPGPALPSPMVLSRCVPHHAIKQTGDQRQPLAGVTVTRTVKLPNHSACSPISHWAARGGAMSLTGASTDPPATDLADLPSLCWPRRWTLCGPGALCDSGAKCPASPLPTSADCLGKKWAF